VEPYRPTGGFTSVGVAAAAEYRWSPTWSTTLFGGYKRLVGSAADSPVTRRFGSPNQFNVGVSLSYSFTTTGF
jgi:outer membrane scaffolding protein for murein synthesis (MipA/OmpV family)